MESSNMKTLFALAALVVPAVAGATGDKIVILAPSGAPAVRAQLSETLCVSEDCVAPDRVLSAGKLDWGKAAREGVSSVVIGHAIAAKSGPQVELQVLGAGGKVKHSEKVALNEDNKLSVSTLVTASAVALESIDSGAPAKAFAKDDAPAKPSAKTKVAAHHARSKQTRRLAARPHGAARG
jgi:hypothetical protein